MGLQGDKATHDFLTLYSAAKDSALPLLPESKPPPPPPAHQGFFLKTHDFLQPLERSSSQSPPPSRPAAEKPLRQHALPGGIGTFSIGRAAAADQPGAAVKQEQPPFAVWGQPDPRGTPRTTRALVFLSPLRLRLVAA
ncbi:transcription factor BIM1-like [Panicum virgatum]|uniref:transcription factor BIM1-like n=1 Tax=Panicum virgatum TaxID=38727 RepID=UPI0019D53BF0|nr:transcription factor BIM1-like [Panicum virgatum]